MRANDNYYQIDEKSSIYDIWEQGGNHGDSVTPSTWCGDYRRMMVELILRYTGGRKDVQVLSLGCGNAVVEAELMKNDVKVTGLDINPEAVRYSKMKGVHAIEMNFFEFTPEDRYDIVYADGFFGHLYCSDNGVSNIYDCIVQKMLKPGGIIVVSNDAPRVTSDDVQEHPQVPNFSFFSPGYLADQAHRANLKSAEVNTFYYSRPVSGLCPRSVVVSKVISA